jgi:hypothetical protein
MSQRTRFLIVVLVVGITITIDLDFVYSDSPKQPDPTAILELFEDDAEGLLKNLTNPTGDPGEGHPEKTIVYSGKQSIKIIPMQRFSPKIPNWKIPITEKPKPGEYRYLRFAWKAQQSSGIMIQFHDEKDWYIRYTAGRDFYNWGTKFVAERPINEWVVVTRDMYQDFGNRTLTGIALTCFDGIGYFDHIYLGRTIEDLDRIDATGLRKNPLPALSAKELDRLWDNLLSKDASKNYLAFWTLVAGSKETVPYIQGKIDNIQKSPNANQIQKWIRDLENNRFAIREIASKELAKHIDESFDSLEAALQANPSADLHKRLEALLALRKNIDPQRQRIVQAIRALEYINNPSSRKCLEEWAKNSDRPTIRELAKTAWIRIRDSQ